MDIIAELDNFTKGKSKVGNPGTSEQRDPGPSNYGKADKSPELRYNKGEPEKQEKKYPYGQKPFSLDHHDDNPPNRRVYQNDERPINANQRNERNDGFGRNDRYENGNQNPKPDNKVIYVPYTKPEPKKETRPETGNKDYRNIGYGDIDGNNNNDGRDPDVWAPPSPKNSRAL
jgi:hypothetical protein